ncbi:MAG: hypothetical protein GY849_02075 [Deltaproteobacteria bacterium]|nr:hypothetical protein [Deltaproteobacteria bacterium]
MLIESFFIYLQMELKQYSELAHSFVSYEENDYPYFLLVEEIGEYAGKIAKLKRGDYSYSENYRLEILKELGDICWALNEIAILHNCFIESNFFKKVKGLRNIIKNNLNNLEKHTLFLEMQTNLLIENNYNSFYNYFGLIDVISREYNSSIEEIFEMNIKKLTDRKNRGKIKGNGDNR